MSGSKWTTVGHSCGHVQITEVIDIHGFGAI